jgi:hypothetical protein
MLPSLLLTVSVRFALYAVYVLTHVVYKRKCSGREAINMYILRMYTFSAPLKAVPLFTYVCMHVCMRASLAPEWLDECY